MRIKLLIAENPPRVTKVTETSKSQKYFKLTLDLRKLPYVSFPKITIIPLLLTHAHHSDSGCLHQQTLTSTLPTLESRPQEQEGAMNTKCVFRTYWPCTCFLPTCVYFTHHENETEGCISALRVSLKNSW